MTDSQDSQDSQAYRYSPQESAAPTPIPNEAQAPATKTDQRLNELWDFASQQLASLALAHLVGYGLLFFAFLALIDLFIRVNGSKTLPFQGRFVPDPLL